MSKDTLIAKYETLPDAARKQVETFIEFLAQTSSPKRARSAQRRCKFDRAAGLADLNEQFTAVELQQHLNTRDERSGHRHAGQGFSAHTE